MSVNDSFAKSAMFVQGASCVQKEAHPLARLLPHRPPFLFVDDVAVPAVDFTAKNSDVWPAGTYVLGRYTVQAHNPFAGHEGVLETVAFAEMLAQCAGALGLLLTDEAAQGQEQPSLGFLASLRDVSVFGTARVGDTLSLYVRCLARIGQISVVEGQVYKENLCLASGQCKIFVEEA